MKNYPEPAGRLLDIAETVIICAIAVLLLVCVYFAVYFSANILGGAL